MPLAGAILLVGAGVLAAPTLVFAVECIVGALSPDPEPDTPDEEPTRAVVLVPAHDEERGIAATLRSLRSDLGPRMSILVVADNCSDATAAVARAEGARVVERTDPERRGKGYALTFGMEALAEDPPDVVIVVDADCRVEPGTLGRLASTARRYGRPAQADYVLERSDETPLSAISAFAFLVRNRTRARGLSRLGLPCCLTGSGMGFPWVLFRQAAPTGSHLVEDLVIGLDLAIQGGSPIYVGTARVTSALPCAESGHLNQRLRWETGRLKTVPSALPRLIRASLAQRRADLLGLAADLLVPPMALHTGLCVAGGISGLVVGALGGGWLGAAAYLGEAALIGGGVAAAWIRDGRATMPPRMALRIPGYMAWKLGIYARILRRGPENRWVRTERESAAR